MILIACFVVLALIFFALFCIGYRIATISFITGLAFGFEFIGKDLDVEIYEDCVILDLGILRIIAAKD